MATLTKTNLIATLARKNRRSQTYYAETLGEILDECSTQLAAGNSIRLTGFGTLRVQTKAARTQRHIKTGEQITIPAHKSVHFKIGEVLKASIQGKKRRK